MEVIKHLHTFDYKIDYNRVATISSFFTPCYNIDKIKIHTEDIEKLFTDAKLFCSNYITLLWKYVLEEFNLDDQSFPLHPYACYPEQVHDVLSRIPTYWDIFLLKSSKIGRTYRLKKSKTKK